MLFAIPVLLSHVFTKNAAVKAGMKSSAFLDLRVDSDTKPVHMSIVKKIALFPFFVYGMFGIMSTA
jgi:hypothetical protein